MTDTTAATGNGNTTAAAPRKRRAPQGPRKPMPIYAFVKTNEQGKPTLQAAMRDPRKMAEYFNKSKEEGSELLVIDTSAF